MESRKKILVFVSRFPVLTETFIERELSKLVERNIVDLIVVALRRGDGSVSENLKDKVFYKREGLADIPGFLVYFFRNFSKVPALFRELEGGFLKKTFVLLKSIGYAKYFSSFQPDLILAHFMSRQTTIALIASKVTGIPFAISAHARDVTVSSENVSQKIKNAKFVTVCNKNAFDYLMKLVGGNPGNIFLSPHGIDFNKINPNVVGGVEKPNKTLILSVGRLAEKKGLKYLIEASKMLKDRGLEHLVYIIGPGLLYGKLMEEVKGLGLEDYVKILGEGKGLSQEETLKYFKSADTFVFPSIQTEEGDVDGVANVLLEAAAFKLPIVATDAGSTGEIILDKETGIVVAQKDSKALADALENIIKDGGLGERLGLEVYSKVLENFDLSKNILKLEGLLTK